MKKGLRSRNLNSNYASKQTNETKPSSKKRRQKRAKRPKVQKVEYRQIANSQMSELLNQQTMKSQSQSQETAGEMPEIPFLNLDHYMEDINNYIIEIDKEFHNGLEANLKSVENLEVTFEMRKILVRWLIKVGFKFRIKSETLHFCVQLIDFMLICKGEYFTRLNFQLLGVTCLFISCKYNEIYAMEADKYIQVCDGMYTVSELSQMEGVVLLQTNFNLQIPTLHQYIHKIIHYFRIAPLHESLIKTLVDLSIFDFNCFNGFNKFQLSTAIVYFVCKVYKLDELKAEMGNFKNQINPEIFKNCFVAVMELFKKSNFDTSNISI